MSRHVFEKLEKTCGRVALLLNRKIIDTIDMKDIHHNEIKTYIIGFESDEDFQKFIKKPINLISKKDY